MDVESHTLNPFYLQRSKQITRWNPEKKNWKLSIEQLTAEGSSHDQKCGKAEARFTINVSSPIGKTKGGHFCTTKGTRDWSSPRTPGRISSFQKIQKKYPQSPGVLSACGKLRGFPAASSISENAHVYVKRVDFKILAWLICYLGGINFTDVGFRVFGLWCMGMV